MLIAAMLAAVLQAPAGPVLPEGITQHPALPALAAKAPGQPPYGIQYSAPEGTFIFTHLRYNATPPQGSATLFRVTGPAGLGPYRLGVQLAFRPKFLTEVKGQKYYSNMFYLIEKALDGGAAKAAGLDEDWAILTVDGKNFDWNLNALISYLTTRPSVEVLALKQKGWGSGSKKKTFQIQLRKQEGPVDPADGNLVPENVASLRPLLQAQPTWVELIRLRASVPRFAPLQLGPASQPLWVVRGVPNPHPDRGEDGTRVFLEFWNEDPLKGVHQTRPSALAAEPTDGRLAGRALKVADRWVRVTEAALDPTTGRLAKLAMEPWKPRIDLLLGGLTEAPDLGPGAALADREALEQLANEALVEWKTRTLPGLLANQTLDADEDLVVRLEKGLLSLDLEVKGLRARLDAAARAEAERKAQAELATKEGKPAPAAPPPAAESERLADLLDQRKAILMAVLGSAKQSLAQLRR